ncbi:histidine phosphatase family protein [Novosphingobium sp. FSW06-99]|uniref:histidine phosphatase family protein n=1 Tax=Novosphingobium sp. FSW06-99 TaxID=1739113 RepID=UPI00076D1142|nr:histidine phosphatase family protein [Novosphingobium sp. FSW06-99]KUR79419.1 phosphoglycerate mutase [Novosphingobium sp. FSW06-99]
MTSILPTVMLIRHGETAWSLSGQHTGRTDIALTANGEAMARELAPMLAPFRFSHVFTSPLQRARRTCLLAVNGRMAVTDADLAEWDYGRYEGLDTPQVHALDPGWNVFTDGSPGGESVADVVARADRVIDRLRTMTGPIAVFSHAHFGRVLAARWVGLPGAAGEHLVLDPASLSVLGARPGYPAVPVIVRWNVVAPDRLI